MRCCSACIWASAALCIAVGFSVQCAAVQCYRFGLCLCVLPLLCSSCRPVRSLVFVFLYGLVTHVVLFLHAHVLHNGQTCGAVQARICPDHCSCMRCGHCTQLCWWPAPCAMGPASWSPFLNAKLFGVDVGFLGFVCPQPAPGGGGESGSRLRASSLSCWLRQWKDGMALAYSCTASGV
jgi:hypothetical protein